ncbi:homogentisate 1,2-dioxygenase [Sporothrix schenckii ATCC 58251]|uniref:homogentisate 1,2-dioxygenase n=1 Tax=Sporothrix schenckii (strain ATCC 58251 / de Perez 2211183) TaxID=1391915 RepID=U7PQU9_SPOS1|nr:homogentisate 1,2-dioxygenase [Sporothrix schenckii ATCC 58251]
MPVTDFSVKEKYRYQNGFDSYHETEAVAGALPIGQNSPQKPPYGLYAEKLSGTAFTAPRHENKQSWLYRITPACSLSPFQPEGDALAHDSKDTDALHYLPDQFRWDPFPLPDPATAPTDFVSGLRQIAGAGDPTLKQGLGIFVYAANQSMDSHTAFYSADGDLLIVPQAGVLDIRTEMGWLLVRPLEICVIPRGVRFQVHIAKAADGDDSGGGMARGYALELYQGHFQLPELGPIGSNGLANARDFQVPVACFDEPAAAHAAEPAYVLRAKVNRRIYRATQPHSPFDVVAWQGFYYPYKYDLGRFNVIGSISFDHPDPSIFTVLTAPSEHAGTAVADFVIFPPRWLVGENTFRPPWYHRNTMSEYMGLLAGNYDAKKAGTGGFVPGGGSLHNTMSGHGPDGPSYEAARNEPQPQQPAKVGAGSCAFMFETCLMLGVTSWALTATKAEGGDDAASSAAETVLQRDYVTHSWGKLPRFWQRPESAGAADSHLLKE